MDFLYLPVESLSSPQISQRGRAIAVDSSGVEKEHLSFSVFFGYIELLIGQLLGGNPVTTILVLCAKPSCTILMGIIMPSYQ